MAINPDISYRVEFKGKFILAATRESLSRSLGITTGKNIIGLTKFVD